MPVPHRPHDDGVPLHVAPSPAPPCTDAANVENFFDNVVEPQCGHGVPFQSEDRTRTSLSRSQDLQWNS